MQVTHDTVLQHEAVLLEEAIHTLVWRKDGVYLDGTFGRGGHSRALLDRLGSRARLIAFDKDPKAIETASQITDTRFECIHKGFAELKDEMSRRGIEQIDGLLLDLGVSSPQLEDASRGFSFRLDGPLDMRMDTTRGETVSAWLKTVSQKDLAQVIQMYGEERFARAIARAIIEHRKSKPVSLNSTHELAELVARVVKTRERGQHPATRTFQALRIHINQELTQLQQVLEAAEVLLAPGGRLVVISFHSLEDRIVKRFIARMSAPVEMALWRDTRSRYLPLRDINSSQAKWRSIGRTRASEAEIQRNPRARSAMMRAAERIAPDNQSTLRGAA
jgi:16S rRNA (cytosine1402-N4)-methyltransferase